MNASPLVASLIVGLVVGVTPVPSVEAYRPSQAMVQVTGARVASTSEVIQCDDDHPVGVWVTAGAWLQGVSIEGCLLGVYEEPASPHALLTRNPSMIRHVTVTGGSRPRSASSRVASAGIHTCGVGGLDEENTTIGLDIGFYHCGREAVFRGNRAFDNRLAGFIVSGGFFNTYEANEARRNGYGFLADATVSLMGYSRAPTGGIDGARPGVGPLEPDLALIETHAQGNLFRGNTALGNTLYDLKDYGMVVNSGCPWGPPEPEPGINTWEDNTYETKRPDCLDVPR